MLDKDNSMGVAVIPKDNEQEQNILEKEYEIFNVKGTRSYAFF